jgi:hypothetical protein
MRKFLKIHEIAAFLNESPEIIVKECEMGIFPHNRTSEGEYLFTIEDVLAVRKPTPKYTSQYINEPVPAKQDETPTKGERKPKGAKKAR